MLACYGSKKKGFGNFTVPLMRFDTYVDHIAPKKVLVTISMTFLNFTATGSRILLHSVERVKIRIEVEWGSQLRGTNSDTLERTRSQAIFFLIDRAYTVFCYLDT